MDQHSVPSLRRSHHRLVLQDGHVDLVRGVAVREGREIELTRMEHRLLQFLATRSDPVPMSRLLTELWGYHPNSRSRAPYVAIQRLRTKIEASPKAPAHLKSVRGRGYVFVAGRYAETPAAADGEALIGRDDDLAIFDRIWASGAPMITVVGPAGVGKTEFVRAAVADGTRGTFVWVDATEQPHEPFERLLFRACGVRVAAAPRDARRALEQLRSDHGVHALVIDSAEDRRGDLAAALREPLPTGLRIVATSRIRMDVPTEQEFRLGPLDPDSGARLMVRVARKHRFGWEPTTAEWRTLSTIAAEQLDGLPLALHLAAGRLGVFSAEELTRRLTDGFEVLRGGRVGRWDSLQAAIQWSWDRLTAEEQRALAQAAYFSGGFDLTVAERIIEVSSGWVVDVLQALVDQSLVRRQRPDADRFELLHTVRAFAAQQLGSRPELQRQVARRHLEWSSELADRGLEAIGASRLGAPIPTALLRELRTNERDLAHARTYAQGVAPETADRVTRLLGWLADQDDHHRLQLIDGHVDLLVGRVVRRQRADAWLSAVERRLLEFLAGQRTAVSGEVLRASVGRVPMTDAELEAAIDSVRSKVERSPTEPHHLRQVAGRGYRFVPEPGPRQTRVALADGFVELRSERVVRYGRPATPLSSLEARIVEVLAGRAGPIPGEELLCLVGPSLGSTSSLRLVVQRLRTKIESDAAQPLHLRDEDDGYEWVAPMNVGARHLTDRSFVGRTHLLRELDVAFAGGTAWVTLTGPGGIGKTRLARRWTSTHADPCIWVDLHTIDSLDTLRETVARAYGLPSVADPETEFDQLASALAARGPHVLVLDGAEGLPHTAKDRVQDWIERAPELRLVVTSRSRMHGRSEHLVPVGPLDQSAAIELVLRTVRQVRGSDWAPSLEDEARLPELAERLEGVPLSLELAAGRIPLLGVAGLLDRLRDQFAILEGQPTASRWNSVAAAIGWSWSLLTETERDALAQVSVFQHPFSVDDAETVVELDGDASLLSTLQRLIDRSLLQITGHARARLTMLDRMREWIAREQPTSDDVRHRHLVWCTTQVPQPVEHASVLDLHGLAQRVRDLKAAHATAVARHDAESAAILIYAIGIISFGRTLFSDFRPMFRRTLDLEMPRVRRAHLLEVYTRGAPEDPDLPEHIAQALANAEDPIERGWLLLATIADHANRSKIRDAVARVPELLEIDGFTSTLRVRQAYVGVWHACELGDPALVEARCHQLRALLPETRDRPFDHYDVLRSLAYGLEVLRRNDEAAQVLEQADAWGERHDMPSPWLNYQWATLLAAKGDFAGAYDRYRVLGENCRVSGRRKNWFSFLARSIYMLLHLRRVDEARTLYAELEGSTVRNAKGPVKRSLNDEAWLGFAAARIELFAGNLEGFRDRIRRGYEAARSELMPVNRMRFVEHLVMDAVARGQPAEGRAYLEELRDELEGTTSAQRIHNLDALINGTLDRETTSPEFRSHLAAHGL